MSFLFGALAGGLLAGAAGLMQQRSPHFEEMDEDKTLHFSGFDALEGVIHTLNEARQALEDEDYTGEEDECEDDDGDDDDDDENEDSCLFGTLLSALKSAPNAVPVLAAPAVFAATSVLAASQNKEGSHYTDKNFLKEMYRAFLLFSKSAAIYRERYGETVTGEEQALMNGVDETCQPLYEQMKCWYDEGYRKALVREKQRLLNELNGIIDEVSAMKEELGEEDCTDERYDCFSRLEGEITEHIGALIEDLEKA